MTKGRITRYNRAACGKELLQQLGAICTAALSSPYAKSQLNITMKTALFALAAVAAAPVMAGTTYTVVEPTNPYSIELGVGYNFAARDVLRIDGVNESPKVDTLGVDITGVYTVNENSSFNLRFGFATGSDDTHYEDIAKLDARVNNFFLMPGYRYTHPMGEYVSGFIGVNAGVINESMKLKLTDEYGSYHAHGSEFGFAYSAEVGLRYRISRHFDVFLAYQFFGSTAEPGINGQERSSIHGREQLYHSVRAGMSFDF